MSNTTFDHPPQKLEEKLTNYWELVDTRDRILTLIAKAKNEKNSVDERIFRKVIADYEGSLESVTSHLDPLKIELDSLRQRVDSDLKELDVLRGEFEDELAEAGFRHRVGEYDDEQLSEARGRILPQAEKIAQQRSELLAQLQAMDRRRPAGDTRVEPPVESAPAAPTENPQEWAEEYSASEWSKPESDAQWDDRDDDPLSALTDPEPASEQWDGASVAGPAAAPTYPNLVIRSGPHAGKIVPLLPMTMNIGREHDNNIELKDQEVSRYHARILYENGRFHIEDLQSSSGTWVNGAGQKRCPLSKGDVIRIGTSELVIEFA